MVPMSVMRNIAGSIADGAFPNDAIPYGNVNTPAPTIDLTKLNISFDIVAVPVVPVVSVLEVGLGDDDNDSESSSWMDTTALIECCKRVTTRSS
jgi:hypothetical protein